VTPLCRIWLTYLFVLFCAAEIGAIIGRDFWWHDYESRDVNKSAVKERRVEGETLQEDFTDHCIAEILGTTSVFSIYSSHMLVASVNCDARALCEHG